MPSTKHYLKRILAIDRKLRIDKRATIDELIEVCTKTVFGEDFTPEQRFSDRTIQYDLKSMREDFHAPISKGRYKMYTEANYSFVRHLLREETNIHYNIVKLYQAFILFSQFEFFSVVDEVWGSIFNLKEEFEQKGLKAKNFLELDINRNVKGLDKIEDLLEAVINQRQIRIQYQNFTSPESKTYLLDPYMIKEYRDIWYLVALDTSQHYKVRNFALDRITDFEILNKTFESVPISRDKNFEHAIGIFNPQMEPVEVKLRIKKLLVPYFRHRPLMPDMEEIEKTEEYSVFQFTAKPTMDLQNEILWWGEGLEVLEPMSLRDEMIRRMDEMRAYYE